MKLILALVLGFSLPAVAREKADQLSLAKGEILFVEVKELSEGSVTCKTNSAGTIYVDWVDVLRLTSTFAYEVELKSGERLVGPLADPSRDGLLSVSEREVEIKDVVGLRGIGSSWRSRLDSDISLGFSYTKSTSLADLAFGAGTVYNGPKWKASARYDSAFTAQGKSDTNSQRHNLDIQPQRYFGRFWYLFGTTGFENNSELELDARITAGAGPGIRALSTNIQFLSFQGGAVFNEEWYSSSAEGQSSAEGLVAATYSIFKKKSPKTSFSLDAQYFPGLTESGRHRIKGNARLRQETITDLFIELSSFVTYDNQPEGVGVAETDTGITTSLGYTF